MEPWNKSLNFVFPTKYVIPKKFKPFSHWPSKYLHPGKWTGFEPKGHGGGMLENEFIDDFPDFNWVIFRFHVGFPGCTY